LFRLKKNGNKYVESVTSSIGIERRILKWEVLELASHSLGMISKLDPVLVDQVISYLGPQDCRTLAVCNKQLYNAACDEAVWKTICLRHIAGLAHYNDDKLQHLVTSIELPGFYQLYCVAKDMKYDPLGYYARRDGVSALMSVRFPRAPQERGLVCDYIDDGGRRYFQFTIMFDIESYRLYAAMDSTTPHHYKHLLTIRATGNIFEATSIGAVYERLGPLIDVPPVNVPCNLGYQNAIELLIPTLAEHKSLEAIHPNLYSCLGFHTAIYGPHGREMLYLSIKESADDTHSGASVLQLSALKVTGDPNVPAGHDSFVIDLDQRFDAAEEIERDHRLLVMFGQDAHAIVAPASRLPLLTAWFRGRGQINRVPGLWDPEWVGCSLWVYCSPLPGTGARCTVVWDDVEDGYRHAMDITPMPMDL
jgi:hypothetical protein